MMQTRAGYSKKLRDSARGQQCTIRIPGVCNYDPETTVLAHLNGAGIGMKHPDATSAAFCCFACHETLDSRVNLKSHPFTRDELELMHRRGIEETQRYWIDEGLLVVT